jgi:hypothetical protein
MTIMFRLEPLIAPQEKLLEALRQRPPISVGPEDTQVVIGRGGLTGIADHSIGKNVFSLEMDDKCRETHSIKATLLKDSDRCRVHVNGRRWEVVGATRYLRNGDFLSLNDLKYEYKLFSMNSSSQATVELLSSPGQASLSTILDEKVPTSLGAAPCSPPSEHPPKKALAPAPSSSSPAITLSADIATRFSDDIQCSICLEIQIYSQTLVPCGHSFCSPCINDLEDCPQCRAKITQLVPSRQLDGLIANMVAVPGLLDAEDVQQYQERKKQHHPTVRFFKFLDDNQSMAINQPTTLIISHYVSLILSLRVLYLVLVSLPKCPNEPPNDNVELLHNIHRSFILPTTIIIILRQLCLHLRPRRIRRRMPDTQLSGNNNDDMLLSLLRRQQHPHRRARGGEHMSHHHHHHLPIRNYYNDEQIPQQQRQGEHPSWMPFILTSYLPTYC